MLNADLQHSAFSIRLRCALERIPSRRRLPVQRRRRSAGQHRSRLDSLAWRLTWHASKLRMRRVSQPYGLEARAYVRSISLQRKHAWFFFRYSCEPDLSDQRSYGQCSYGQCSYGQRSCVPSSFELTTCEPGLFGLSTYALVISGYSSDQLFFHPSSHHVRISWLP